MIKKILNFSTVRHYLPLNCKRFIHFCLILKKGNKIGWTVVEFQFWVVLNRNWKEKKIFGSASWIKGKWCNTFANAAHIWITDPTVCRTVCINGFKCVLLPFVLIRFLSLCFAFLHSLRICSFSLTVCRTSRSSGDEVWAWAWACISYSCFFFGVSIVDI